MRLTDEQIAAIRDGTEGVTPGPWEVSPTSPVVVRVPHSSLSGMAGLSACIGRTDQNAAHLSRCDPDTIRALAAEVLESRAAIAAKDARIAELEQRAGFVTWNDGGNYAEITTGDTAQITHDINGADIAVLFDMNSRKLVGLRLYGARAVLGKDAT